MPLFEGRAGEMGKTVLKMVVLLLMALYILSPIDFIPDFLFPVGFIDDIIVLFGGLTFLGYDVIGFGRKAKSARQEYQASRKK